MKITNYNRGLVRENIETLKKSTKRANIVKNRVKIFFKILFCLAIVVVGVIGSYHAFSHPATGTTNLIVTGSLIALATVLCTVLFSVALMEASAKGWEKHKTFEMLYYDVANKGKLLSVEKHPTNDEVILTYLDDCEYVQKEVLGLTKVVLTPSVDEDTLDVSRGILSCHYQAGPGVKYE
jgi:hypothetical protein